MLTESLRLKGFRGIRDGMGLNEISLDFTGLPAEASLIAIAGPNGRGKTTVMDNLHPYPVMPSRAGKDGLGRFSYYEHLCLPESEKELVWSHGGRRFRTHMVFRMNGKKKTEAFLFEWRAGQWTAALAADGTVSDGKVDTYSRCVADVLGTPEAFFLSQFSAQGRRPLSAYTSGEIKSLLAELLGHAALLEKSAQAAEVAKLLRAGLVSERAALANLEGQVEQAKAARGELGIAQQTEANARTTREQAQANLEAAKTALAQARADAAGSASHVARRQGLAERIKAERDAGQAAAARLNEQRTAARQRLAALGERVKERRATTANQLSAAARRCAELQNALQARPRVNQAVRRMCLAARAVEQRYELEAAAQAKNARAAQIDAEVALLKERILGIENEAGKATLHSEDLARRFGLTREVPCAGTDLQGQCKLLSDAREAQAVLPSAQHKVEQLAQDRRDLSEKTSALQAERSGLGQAMAAQELAKRRRQRAEGRLRRFELLAARKDEMARLEADLGTVTREHEQLAACDVGPTEAERDEDQTIRTAITSADEALDLELKRNSNALEALQADFDALPAPFDAATLTNAEVAEQTAIRACTVAEDGLLAAVRKVQSLTDAAAQEARCALAVSGARAKIAGIEAKTSTWGMLAKALGQDGIVALSIDDAGPTLSALANELLLRCYGPQYTVALHTQVATGKGELREGFSIVVHDGNTGESKLLDNMSGGQRVWINECLTRAIALYLAQTSGHRYQTLFCDEADGSLDPERKRMFMAMKRAVLELGGYAREVFISQTPELTAMADAVIDLNEYCEVAAP